MLLINILEHQTVRIGEDHMLQVDNIYSDRVNVTVIDVDNKKAFKVSLTPSSTVQLLERVEIMLVRVTEADKMRAVLGFNAPRCIEIRGTWFGPQKRDAIQLSALTDSELVLHAKQVARTPLEQELIERLDARS